MPKVFVKPLHVLAFGLSGSLIAGALLTSLVPHHSGVPTLNLTVTAPEAYSTDCTAATEPCVGGDGQSTIDRPAEKCSNPTGCDVGSGGVSRTRHGHRVPCNVKYQSAHRIHVCKVHRRAQRDAQQGEIGTAVSLPASGA
jgi:hypothetical protein